MTSKPINIDAARKGLDILMLYAQGCPDAQDAAGMEYIRAARMAVSAALDELELAQPVVGIFRGRSIGKHGDEISVYATADEVGAIGRAMRGR